MAVRADDVDLLRDRALVERCQDGDVAGFEDLYRRYFHRLYRYCLRRVGNPHEAEELAQESFARAYRAMPGLVGERRFYPWLTVIASRLCVDNHRRTSRVEPSDVIDLGSVEGGQEAVFDEVDRTLLRQALGQLGPRHREVLRLREDEGWSYQHIADHYEVSLGTVEALLWRARKALRREFEKVGGVETGLAGLPIFGAIARRLHAARMRFAAWGGEALTPYLSNAVVAAVLMTSVAGMTGAFSSGGASAVPVRTITPASATRAPVTAASDVISSATSDLGGTPTSQVAGADAPKKAPRVVVGAELQRGSAPGKDYSENAPVSQNAGPLTAGADPQAVAKDTVSVVAAVASSQGAGQ